MDEDDSGTVELEEFRKAFRKINFDNGMNKSEKFDSPKSSSTGRGYMKINRHGSKVSSGSGFSLSQAKRKSFKARHGKNIAKGVLSAAYWANKVKW